MLLGSDVSAKEKRGLAPSVLSQMRFWWFVEFLFWVECAFLPVAGSSDKNVQLTLYVSQSTSPLVEFSQVPSVSRLNRVEISE
jgi:hypothetical protein